MEREKSPENTALSALNQLINHFEDSALGDDRKNYISEIVQLANAEMDELGNLRPDTAKTIDDMYHDYIVRDT